SNNLSHLCASVCANRYARADRAAVGLGPLKLERKEVSLRGGVLEDRRLFVDVDDNHLWPAVAVEIAGSYAARRTRHEQRGTRLAADIVELSVAEVAVQDRRLAIRFPNRVPVHFRVDV